MSNFYQSLYDSYSTVGARQAVDYIGGICDKCFTFAIRGNFFPEEDVLDIIKPIADEIEYLEKKLEQEASE